MADSLHLNTGAAPSSMELGVMPSYIPTSDVMSNLASLIMRVFQENVEHREVSGIDAKLLDSMRLTRSEYSPEEIAKFKAAGIPGDLFTPLTATKNRAALAQVTEIFTSPGDRPWTISPTPVPTVPKSVTESAYKTILAELIQVAQATGNVPTPEQSFQYAEARMDEVFRKEMQWAKVRAERMERKVHDQMVEGGWLDAFNDYCQYLVEYGTAVIRGPIPRVVLKKKMKETKLGTRKYVTEPKEILCYEAVNPWDCYPSKGARDINEGYLCIRTQFTAESLWRYASKSKSSGDSTSNSEWKVDTIEALLQRFPEGGVKLDPQAYDIPRQRYENNGIDARNRCVLEGIDFYGTIRGSMLIELGIVDTQDGTVIEDSEFYEVNAICIAGYIIYCKVINECIGRPLSKGVFYEVTGSWWGGSIAEKVKPTQRITNSALRNLVNNMAMASGPMLYIKDMARVADKTPDALVCKPWKVLKFNNGSYGQTDVPVGVLEFSSHLQELVALFKEAYHQADEDSGIPAYTYGQNVSGGAGRTASGLAMLTEAANRVMKMVVTTTDRKVIRDCVRRTVDYNLVYDPDVSIKGDVEVNPAGVMSLVLREAESNRRKQLLQLALTPSMLQIVGPKLPTEIIREEIKMLGLPNVDDVLPSKEKLEQMELLQQLQQLNQAIAQQQQVRQQAQTAQQDQVTTIGDSPQAAATEERIIENPSNPNGQVLEGEVNQRRGAA